MTIEGRRVLVTGGGSGAGADLALGFARAGAAEVVICGRFDELPRLLHDGFTGLAAGIVFPPLDDAGDDESIAACVQRLAAAESG